MATITITTDQDPPRRIGHLLLKRHPGQRVAIGSDISVAVVRVEPGGNVTLRISAPITTPVYRGELIDGERPG